MFTFFNTFPLYLAGENRLHHPSFTYRTVAETFIDTLWHRRILSTVTRQQFCENVSTWRRSKWKENAKNLRRIPLKLKGWKGTQIHNIDIAKVPQKREIWVTPKVWFVTDRKLNKARAFKPPWRAITLSPKTGKRIYALLTFYICECV